MGVPKHMGVHNHMGVPKHMGASKHAWVHPSQIILQLHYFFISLFMFGDLINATYQ